MKNSIWQNQPLCCSYTKRIVASEMPHFKQKPTHEKLNIKKVYLWITFYIKRYISNGRTRNNSVLNAYLKHQSLKIRIKTIQYIYFVRFCRNNLSMKKLGILLVKERRNRSNEANMQDIRWVLRIHMGGIINHQSSKS